MGRYGLILYLNPQNNLCHSTKLAVTVGKLKLQLACPEAASLYNSLIFILECHASGYGTQNALFPSRDSISPLQLNANNIFAKTYVQSLRSVFIEFKALFHFMPK